MDITEQPKLKRDDIIELRITDQAEKDQCFGRLDNGMGVMVSGMLAVGDLVSAKIKKVRQRYIEAFVVKVLEPCLTVPILCAAISGFAVDAS